MHGADRCRNGTCTERCGENAQIRNGETSVILRIDKLAIELPMPAHPSPNSASAVQELLGGKFGEMSTLMNYTFQSFNFRGCDKGERVHEDKFLRDRHVVRDRR